MDNQFSCIKNLNDLVGLSDADIQQVIEAAKEAKQKGEWLAVVLQDIDYGDGDIETTIYQLDAQDDDWVHNYYQSGGMWYYDTPDRFLSEVIA